MKRTEETAPFYAVFLFVRAYLEQSESFVSKLKLENFKIMEKDWQNSSLSADIHDVLREKERRLPNFMSASPQLNLRRFLVDWLAIITEKIGSSHGVLHLAVYYMDFFMDKFMIQESQIHLLALSCFLLAGWF